MARFEKGRAKTGGRVKGSPVTNSLLLKDAAPLACQLEGDIDLLGIDLKDKRQRKLLRERYKKLTEEAAERGGLLGYFRWIAREHPTAMMSFLGRLLPFQVKADAQKTVEYRSIEEVQRDIVRMKLPLRRIIPLLLDIVGSGPASNSQDAEERQ